MCDVCLVKNVCIIHRLAESKISFHLSCFCSFLIFEWHRVKLWKLHNMMADQQRFVFRAKACLFCHSCQCHENGMCLCHQPRPQ